MGKRARARREAAHNAAFATYVHYDGPEPTVDPRALAHIPGSAHYGPPAFNNTIKAFDLAHRLGVEPSCETIRTLDRIVSMASASHCNGHIFHPFILSYQRVYLISSRRLSYLLPLSMAVA